jgi:hypothetical protein
MAAELGCRPVSRDREQEEEDERGKRGEASWRWRGTPGRLLVSQAVSRRWHGGVLKPCHAGA